MCSRQLFGYWNVILILGSPLYVIFPTVNRENLSAMRRTHITYVVGHDHYHSENGFRFVYRIPSDTKHTQTHAQYAVVHSTANC